MTGRWAPSPTGEFHLGNLRTGLLAWLFARSTGSEFLWRFEDLDAAVRREFYAAQLDDFSRLGLDWDGGPILQRDRLDIYRDALQDLKDKGLTYNCWCTRKEIRESVSAPHNGLPDGAYNGRCRWLSAKEISEYERSARSPATRIITNGEHLQFEDRQVGLFEGAIDDFVLARGDGTPSYNLTSVVDDAAMGVTEVVRGDDLLSTTPRQLFLCEQLTLKAPTSAHVPLVLNSAGKRLAKRDGAVTLSQRISMGESVVEVLNYLLSSLSLDSVSTVMELELVAKVFNPTKLPRHAWILDI